MCFKVGDEVCFDEDFKVIYCEYGFIDCELNIDGGLGLSVDLVYGDEGSIIGYWVKCYSDLIDVEKKVVYDLFVFWELIKVGFDWYLILDLNEFYILFFKEVVCILFLFVVEMVFYNFFVGEFRVYYVGFFDFGFGY